MNLLRISAIIQRHLLILFRDSSRLAELFYWPLFDIVIWGFATTWFGQNNLDNKNLVFATLSCLVLWQVVYRTCQDVSLSVIEEIWARNLVNLFSTPISILEWMTAVMILGLLKVIPSTIFAFFVVWYLYGIKIYSLGFILIPYLISLIISGWVIGIFISTFLIYWGHRVQTLVWSLGYAFSPISGVFFSITVFAKPIQLVSKSLPTTYIFESVRELVFKNTINWGNFYIASFLNIFYFILTLILFKLSFESSRKLGLSRLEVD